MEKLIIQANDLDSAKALLKTLRGLDIDSDAITVLANEHTPMDDLPDADIEGSDVLPAYKRGAAIGGTAGLLLGLTAVVFPPAGIIMGGGTVVAGAMGGASFGAFAAALIGVNVPNSQLEEYEEEVKNGKLLIIVPVEDEQVDLVRGAVSEHHTDATIRGTIDFVPPAA